MTNFQFSIFNQFSKKPVLRLVLLSVVCITFGVVVGLVLNYQTLKELRSPKTEPTQMASEKEEEEKEKIATYSGTIKPSAPALYSEGTHYLEDADGEIITLLESSKIDLGLVEGWEVEVEGTIKELEEGQKLLEVTEIRL